MPAVPTSGASPPRRRAAVLPVRVGTSSGARSGRVTRRRQFTFSTSEAQAAATLLSVASERGLEVPAAMGAGMRGLRDRGLIALTPPSVTGDLRAGWRDDAAAAAAARRLLVPFNLSMRTQQMLTHAADVLEGYRHDFSATALAVILAHRYRFTGVHALTVSMSRAGAAAGLMSARTGEVEVVEHAHGGAVRHRLLPSVQPDPGRLRRSAPGLDTDQRRVLLPGDVEAQAMHAYFQCQDHSATGFDGDASAVVRLDLDRLTAPTHRAWMPALLADTLTHLGVDEGGLPTPDAFVAWAHESLRYPLRCGTFTHIRQIDPVTGTIHTPVEHAEQYAAEEMLTALRLGPGEMTGCAAAEEFLSIPLDGSIWQGVADEMLLRWVVRAVQYLDAGLDLHEAADFLLFAIPAGQAADLIGRRREQPVEVNGVLHGWVRSLLNRGTLT